MSFKHTVVRVLFSLSNFTSLMLRLHPVIDLFTVAMLLFHTPQLSRHSSSNNSTKLNYNNKKTSKINVMSCNLIKHVLFGLSNHVSIDKQGRLLTSLEGWCALNVTATTTQHCRDVAGQLTCFQCLCCANQETQVFHLNKLMAGRPSWKAFNKQALPWKRQWTT